MNVLAVVSKAIFEKEARSGGKVLGEGSVWPTALYASQSPHLAPLASGGALFLVTVRPGDRLWLVAILEAPKSVAKGWAAAANTTPIRDVTTSIPALRFASGKGVTAEPGKLGMSLQTPRVLTDADVALLRGAPSTPAAAYAAVLEATPAMQKASAHAKAALAEAEASGGLVWRLENRRARKRWKSCTASERALLDRFEGELEEAEEFGGCELLDVIDTASGRPVALFALWPFGSGVVIDLASNEELADVVQHYFDAHGDHGLRTRLAAAYAEARARLGIAESVDFTPGEDSKKPSPLGAADETTLPAIRAMRAELAADPQALVSNEAQARLSTLMRQVLDFERYRPVPVRRLFALTELERELLELVEDGAQSSATLWPVGLPDHVSRFYRKNNPALDPGALARFLGRVPPGPLDETIPLEGRAHPLWCLLHDAIHGVREVEAVLALLRALPVERRVAIARAWLLDPTSRLSHVVARDLKELRKGVLSKETSAPQHERRAALKSGLLDSLGPEGEALAAALVAERAGWAAENGPKLEKNPMLQVAWLALLCTALAMMARAARARGEWLDPSHDPLIGALAHSYYTTDGVREVLALLPRERAERIACAKLELIAAYPSDEGAVAARRLLETWVDGGAWTSKLFTEAVKALGERMRPYLVDAKAKVPARAALIDAATALLDKAAAKSAKKTPKPKKRA